MLQNYPTKFIKTHAEQDELLNTQLEKIIEQIKYENVVPNYEDLACVFIKNSKITQTVNQPNLVPISDIMKSPFFLFVQEKFNLKNLTTILGQ